MEEIMKRGNPENEVPQRRQTEIQPKVSVIIPIYNVEKYLRGCLDSAVNQTLKNIEIICADDGSADGSRAVIAEYEAKDARIRAVYHESNKGTLQTRKDAVLASRGEYVMFLDGDDSYEPNACETAYREISSIGTDMLQFGTNVVNKGLSDEKRIKDFKKFAAPFIGKIENADFVKEVFVNHKFEFSLTNKIYAGDLVRRAFSHVEDGFYNMAEDLYQFMVIAYFSKSYCGIADALYNYNFGIGLSTGGKFQPYDKFEKIVAEYDVYKAIGRFFESMGRENEYADVIAVVRDRFLNGNVSCFVNKLVPEEYSRGFDLLAETWGYIEVIKILAEKWWDKSGFIAEKLKDAQYFKTKFKNRPKGKKLTIAQYLYRIANGGAERVVAQLCSMWANIKDENGEYLYNVILLTDDIELTGMEEKIDEYPLDGKVKRVKLLPDHRIYKKGKYAERADAWEKILDANDIDIVIHNRWREECLLWDMLCVKGHPSKPAFLIHSHNFCAVPYRSQNSTAYNLTKIYGMCDGAAALSKADEFYTRTFCANTRYIPNPPSFDFDKIPDPQPCDNTLVWVGRIANEKQPLDAVYMMSELVKTIPHAKLYMVGAENEELFEKLRNAVRERNLQDNIILTGFSDNVQYWYSRAKAFISTSKNEGFPMTFSESMACGCPIISYNMPYLEFLRDGRGIVTVPQGRYDLMAKEAARILRDSGLRKKLSQQAKEQIKDIYGTDIAEQWQKLFDNIGIERADKYSLQSIVFGHIAEFQQIARDAKDKKTAAANKDKTKAEKDKANTEKKLQASDKAKKELEKKLSQSGKKLQKAEDKAKKAEKKLKEAEAKAAKAQKQLKQIQSGMSFRIGRVITWLPRKLAGKK